MKNKQHSILAELGNLLILAELARQKKTAVVSPVSETKDTTTATERRQVKTSVSEDSSQQS